MAPFTDPNLLYGFNPGDDTGVYRLDGELALVQSADFFTPIVDDPYQFGRIAAANAFSDLYTMGAKPLLALNIIGFPCKVGVEIISDILRGGADATREAGAVILGGHSVDDAEPKYGLAVTGVVHPQKMVTSHGARPGDELILTKKIGVGIIANMAKLGGGLLGALGAHGPAIGPAVQEEAVAAMMRLNRAASGAMVACGARACTDVSGFGLLGHGLNMAAASGARLAFSYGAVPRYDGVEAHAIAGTKGGGERNYHWVKAKLTVAAGVAHEQVMMLCDAQTSGGLLIAAPPERAGEMLQRLHDGGDAASAIVGHVEQGPPGTVAVHP